ncbi:MAG: LuxR C-terminal-related transcriptional regulator [Gaiellaceae bacterium]
MAVRSVGREPELGRLRAFVAADPLGALVLTGEPGIGKTTLWEAGIDAARERGLRVLLARPSGAEAQLSFAGLNDLFDGFDLGGLSGLPAPQLRALDVALLRAEPLGAPPEARAIATGVWSALRAAAAAEPRLVASDDAQWLDAASADALAFAARRLQGEAVGFLIARRTGRSSPVERALEQTGLERLEVGPLSFGATRRLLSERLGGLPPRRDLRRIFESSRGNPLFALELGRTLAGRGPLEAGEDIPVPDAVEDLLGTRMAQLPGPVRRLLLAVALSADLRVAQLAAVADPVALDDAVDAGVLLVDGDRVRPSHPLLAAAARRHARAGERRELHLELAAVVADEELRALHLALATRGPDAGLAGTVAAAGSGAAARGAVQEAVVLAEHALRLTPPGSTDRSDRLLELAGHLEVAGEPERVTELLAPELDSLPRGAARVRAQLLLSEGGGVLSVADHQRHFELALAESGDDPVLRAQVLAKQAIHTAAACLERIGDAEAWAVEALSAARLAGPDVERLALSGLAWARSLRGRPIDDLCERFDSVSDAASYIAGSPERVAGQRHVWRGEVKQARVVLTRLLSVAEERGEPVSYALQRLHLCELELRAGEWEAASALLDEWHESPEGELLVFPMYERCRALLAAGRGLPDEAERWAAEAIARAQATVRWDLLEALRARGLAALLAHEPATAIECLRAVWEHTRREGIDDPGAFPVGPDLVEALVEAGEPDEARAVTLRLRELAEQQEHPWGLASGKRCDALLRLASSYDEEAAAALAQAADDHAELGLRVECGRALLGLGRAQRRHRKWAAARRSLEQAAAAFEEIGSAGWAEEARSELARVGARRPRPTGELTPSERRVAELAAEGLSNKEIARTLFVTVNTVEAHLSHAYAKLGVRSRVQLASRLAAQ